MELFDVSMHVPILYFEMFQSHPEVKIEHKQAVGFDYPVFVAARFTEIFLRDKPSIALDSSHHQLRMFFRGFQGHNKS